MTTPYAISTSKGSMSYNNYVNTPIFGPLSTNQFPCTIPYHSYGTLTGSRLTPPQFYPSQEPVYSEMNTNARNQFFRTAISNNAKYQQINAAKLSSPISFYSHATHKYYPVSSHTNYIPPIDSSLYVNIKKSNAVGQTAYKIGLANNVPTSTKNYYPSGTRTTIRRARSGGCVAPKKKGAIENTSLRNGQVCAWGSIVRSTY